jgi:hypothetical protein
MVHRSLVVRLGRIGLGVAAVTAVAVLSACSHPGNPASSAPPSNAPSASAAPSASPAAATQPTIVAVTGAGALVTLNPATGVVEQTLVPSGVVGDEVSVASNGMIYFVAYYHCTDSIEAIPMSGGTPAVIVAGASAPAVSPDGTKLAYALADPCGPPVGMLRIRTLSSGATVSLPALSSGQAGGLPYPISYLSWSADNDHVAVSIEPSQDNEGYSVNLVDIAQARYYVAGSGVVTVPVTGSPDQPGTYLGEGAYMPDGDLFVSRACCQGNGASSSSSLLWEVTRSGVFVHQVAIGYPSLSHFSLNVSPDGRWLLYVAAGGAPNTGEVFVSNGGATPSRLTTVVVAAAWG